MFNLFSLQCESSQELCHSVQQRVHQRTKRHLQSELSDCAVSRNGYTEERLSAERFLAHHLLLQRLQSAEQFAYQRLTGWRFAQEYWLKIQTLNSKVPNPKIEREDKNPLF